MKQLVIAIDGPAASGKSTTAKLTARRMGYLFVDTGAMYRAMTLKVLSEGIDPGETVRVGAVAEQTRIQLQQENEQLRVLLDGHDVTRAIRAPGVTKAVSAVSAVKRVRDVMVREQRRLGAAGGVVLEGRDIGTVVFPNADLKIFMVANVHERARRRKKELAREGLEVALETLADEIVERDQKDSVREVSPLRKAEDAIVLDTSELTIDQQVEFIVERANAALERRTHASLD